MLSEYIKSAALAKVKPNSELTYHLSNEDTPLRCFDLSRNYVGSGNGYDAALVPLLRSVSTIEMVNLSYTFLSSDHVRVLCDALRSAPKLHTIAFQNCGLFIEAAQHILALARVNTNVRTIVLTSDEHTPNANEIPQRWLLRIAHQLADNRRNCETV